MIGLWMGLGCPADAPPEAPGDDIVEPLPWTFSAPERGEEVDLVAIASALDQGVLDAMAIDARQVVDAYVDRLATSADVGCPQVTADGLGNTYWLSGCTTDDGTSFGGFLFQSNGGTDGGFSFVGDALNGNARITSGDGSTIDIQGSVGFLQGETLDGSADVVFSEVSGGFALDPAPPGWLASGPQSVEIAIVGIALRAIAGTIVQVTGSVVTAGDDGTVAVLFDETAMASGPLSACDEEPGGIVEVRDPAGRWIEIAFDGPVLDVSPGDATACDGCGLATLDGAELGTVCADFTPWLSWEALP